MYLTVKSIHISLVALSVLLFLVRGLLLMLSTKFESTSGIPHYRHNFFRRVPPVIDTLLLLSGVTLMVMSQQYPTTQSWLAVKLTALIVYIVLGVLALNRINNIKLQRIIYFAAILVVFWMVSIATTHQPYGFLANYESHMALHQTLSSA